VVVDVAEVVVDVDVDVIVFGDAELCLFYDDIVVVFVPC